MITKAFHSKWERHLKTNFVGNGGSQWFTFNSILGFILIKLCIYMLEDGWMEGFEEFAILFFSDFITCSMTLTLDKRNKDKLSRRLEAALSTDTSGPLILSSYIRTVSNFSTFSKLSSLTWLIFILTLKPVLYFVLTAANFALWIWSLCFSLGLVIWSSLSSCFSWYFIPYSKSLTLNSS